MQTLPQDLVLDCLYLAGVASEDGVKESTCTKYARNWDRWRTFSHSIGFINPFIDKLVQPHQLGLLATFMQSVRRKNLSGGCKKTVQSDVTKEAAEYVGKVILLYGGRPNFVLGPDRKLHICLNYQPKGYRKANLSPKNQQYLSPKVYRRSLSMATTDLKFKNLTISAEPCFFPAAPASTPNFQGHPFPQGAL